MDTVIRIFDPVRNTEIYLLKDWGPAKPDQVVAWENLVLTRIGGAPVCDYYVDNLKWIGEAILNSISLDLWESIEKYLLIKGNGPDTYAAVNSKIWQVRSSVIRNLVDELRKVSIIKEPGQDAEIFLSQVLETHRIFGYGSETSDITSSVTQ